jgi:uncharacterized protein
MPTIKLALLSVVLVAPLASAASFNCAKAASNIEKMVCAHPELSRQDDYLNGSFQRAVDRVGDKSGLREWQRRWLKSPALNACKTTECVKLAYGTRVKLLDDAVKSPWNGHYVRHVKGKPDRNAAEIMLVGSIEGGVIGEGSTMALGSNAGKFQVNSGRFGALGALSGATLTFKDRDCQLSATQKGNVLRVEDNNKCAANATFAGEYRRQ